MIGTRSNSKANEGTNDAIAESPIEVVPQSSTPTSLPATLSPIEQRIKSEFLELELTAEERAIILAMRIPPPTIGTPPLVKVPNTKEKTVVKTETKPFDLKMLLKDKFTMSSTLNKARFEQLDRILRSNGLYTLASKTRSSPCSTADNLSGYTEQSYVQDGNTFIVTSADSIPNFVHDTDRLETIMHIAFDKALFHQSEGFITHDPVRMYTDLRKYFHGQDNHGIQAARVSLSKFKVNPSLSLRADITLFEECMTNLEYASGETMTENIALSVFDEKFQQDNRFGVRERLTYCQCAKYTYAQTIEAFKDIPNASVAPNNHHRMLTVQAKSSETCNNYAKGRCTFGERCKYIHDEATTHKAPAAKPVHLKVIQDTTPSTKTAPPKPLKPKAPLPNYITEKHRSEIGTPTGLISPTNPLGMSRKQYVVLKHLQARDTEWNLPQPNRGARDTNGNEYQFKMTMFSVINSPPPEVPNDPIPYSSCKWLQYHPPTPPLPRSAPYAEPSVRDLDLHGHSYEFMRSATPTYDVSLSPVEEDEDEDNTQDIPVMSASSTYKPRNKYQDDVAEFIRKTVMVFTHCLFPTVIQRTLKGYMSFCYDEKPTDLTKAFAVYRSVNIFGWKSTNMLVHSDPQSSHIYLGDPHLLELVNVIGSVLFHANMQAQRGDIPLTAGSYNSFSPFSDQFNHQGSPGSYTSSVIGINDYVYHFETAVGIREESPIRPYIFLAIIYDFMAFTSQFYRQSLLDRNPTPLRLEKPREVLLCCIETVAANAPIAPVHYNEFQYLMEIFRAIAENAAPIPVMPPATSNAMFHTPVASRKRYPSPPSEQQEPDEALIKRPRYSDGHDEASDDGEAELEFSPMTHPRPTTCVIDLSQPFYPTVPATPDRLDERDVPMDYFSTIAMNTMASQETTIIMDSGAGRTGTSDMSLLSNVQPSNTTTIVSGAFGPPIKPSHTGTFGPHKLEALYIKSMGPQTLVSLSQFCNAGNQFVGVFTPTEYRMYDLTSALPALNILAAKGIEAERGTVRNGIYIRS